jgi:hypothetical protein
LDEELARIDAELAKVNAGLSSAEERESELDASKAPNDRRIAEIDTRIAETLREMYRDAIALVQLGELDALRELAEEHGYAPAQSELGWMYADGVGVSRNYAEAKRWFERAAQQDYADGLAGLGTLYLAGDGVPEDDDRGMNLLRQGADRGSVTGQILLGALQASEAVPEDPVSALKMAVYSRAASLHAQREESMAGFPELRHQT